jgi:hypothetical protein
MSVITGLEVDLVYGNSFSHSVTSLFTLIFLLVCGLVAMHDYDVITKRAVFRNVDTRPCSGNDVNACSVTSPLGNSKVVQKACSVTVDFEATVNPFFLVHLSGRHVVC